MFHLWKFIHHLFWVWYTSVSCYLSPFIAVEHKELKEATNNFDQRLIIGEGGFGVVYKGHNFRSAGTTVAIKVLNKV